MADANQEKLRGDVRDVLDRELSGLVTGDLATDVVRLREFFEAGLFTDLWKKIDPWVRAAWDADDLSAMFYEHGVEQFEFVSQYQQLSREEIRLKAEARRQSGAETTAPPEPLVLAPKETVTAPAGSTPEEVRAISEANGGANVRVDDGDNDVSDTTGTEASTPTGSPPTGDTTGPVSGGAGAGSVTTPEGSVDDPTFMGLPPGSQVWNIGGMIAVAYTIEDGDPESGYVYYGFPTEQAFNRAFPGEKPVIRNLTQQEADRLGGVFIGSTNLLRDDLTQGWQEGFYRGIDTNVKLQPWLEDPEVLATVLAATLEGRAVTESELESTDYFADRSDAEIQYVAFAAKATPDELDQYHLKFEDQIRDTLEKAGVRSPDDTIVGYMGQKIASGQWTNEYATRQVMSLANPYSNVQMDGGLAEVVSGVDVQSLGSETEAVRAFVRQWLGPNGDAYSEEFYRSWAGAIMDDPNAQDDLIDLLKQQRLALYPEYANENLTYQDIAGPWQQRMAQRWGMSTAELDQGVLDRVIRTNDAMEADKILRTEGFNRGVQTVVRDVETSMLEALSGLGAGQVRRSL